MLQCIGPDSLVIPEGTSALVRCEAKNCDYGVNFEWRTSSAHNMIHNLFQNKSTVIGDVRADRSLHGEFVFCVATSPSFPLSLVNCSIGPFYVLRVPVVQVAPQKSSLILPMISEVGLRCLADGYPVDYFYEWTYNPPDIPLHLDLKGNSVTITLQNKSSFDINNHTAINIICLARNAVGGSQNIATHKGEKHSS